MNAFEGGLQELLALEEVRLNPVSFMRDELRIKGDKWELDVWQIEMAEAIADCYRKQQNIPTKVNHDGKNMFTIRAMHGPGKTFGVAAIMHWFNHAFRGRIICTAPKQEQLKTRLWPAFRKILARADKKYQGDIKVDSTKITWHDDEDWCALAETASQPENLAGYHDDYLLFIVDEASGVNEQMFPVIEGALSSGILVLIILIGNPTKNEGTFWASHCRPAVAKNYFQIHVDLSKTTRVSQDWVRKMEEKYGRNSPVVKIRCYGEFADGDKAQLIPYAWLPAALERDIAPGALSRIRITCDVADGGEDFTVATIGRLYGDGQVVVLKQYQASFPSSEAPILAGELVIKLWEQFKCNAANGDDVVIDSLGVGAGTAGYVMQKGTIPVITYKGGEASDDVHQWRNRRTQSYICMRDAHRDGTIAYAENFLDDDDTGFGDWDEFTAQMCSVRTKPGVERIEELETKEEMKRRGIKSPDRADGCAMLYATQSPTMAVQLSTISTCPSTASQGDWN